MPNRPTWATADFPCGAHGRLVVGKVSGMPESRRASLAPVAVLERALDLGGNQGEGCRERRVYTQIGGIEQVGVRGLFQGRNRPGLVGRVPGVEFGQQVLPRPGGCPWPSVPASGGGRGLPGGHRHRAWRWRWGRSRCRCRARPSPRRGCRRADGPGSSAGNPAGRRAPPGWRRRGRPPCRPCRCGCAGSPARLKSMVWAPRRASASFCGIALGFQHRQRGQAIERAGIQMGEAEMRRQLLGQGALAAGGGAVDGDDDGLRMSWRFHNPRPGRASNPDIRESWWRSW